MILMLKIHCKFIKQIGLMVPIVNSKDSTVVKKLGFKSLSWRLLANLTQKFDFCKISIEVGIKLSNHNLSFNSMNDVIKTLEKKK